MARGRTEPPEPVDLHVGQEIRARRVRLGLNQSELGRAIGVTFQQVQKYEKGTNRVSASTLVKCASALACHPADFFPGTDTSSPPVPSIVALPGGVKLEALYLAMSPQQRRALVTVAEVISEKA